MDWLSKHRVIVDCNKISIVLKCSDQMEVTVNGIQAGPLSDVISTIQACQFLRKRCKDFFFGIGS